MSLRRARFFFFLGGLAFFLSSSKALLLLFALRTLPWLGEEDVINNLEARRAEARARVTGRAWRGTVFPETAISFIMMETKLFS